MLGLALAHGWYDADPLPLLLLSGFFLTLSLICRLLGIAAWPAALLAVCLLGLWRYEISQPITPPLLADYRGQVQVSGRIVSDPEATSTHIKFVLQPTALSRHGRSQETGWLAQDAKILVYAHPSNELVRLREKPYFRYGDRLELTGELRQPEPIGRFDYPAYLESQGIYGVLWARDAPILAKSDSRTVDPSLAESIDIRLRGGIYDLRRKLAWAMDKSLPPQEAAVAKALLLGLRGQLPHDIVENFRQSGTSHLLAISGLHLGILLLLTLGFLHWALGRHTPVPLILALASIWLYVVTSGAPASVVRAALMGNVYLAALGLGRPRESLLPALAFSVLAMTALEPQVASQISFQLSFAAMAGIALALPWQEAASLSIAGRVAALKWRIAPAVGVGLRWFVSGTIISASATLATFPLVALNFGTLPLLGIPSTILATPLLPFALIGGLAAAAAAAGLIHPFLGEGVGLLASIPLSALLTLVDMVPKWTVELDGQNSLLAWLWYAALVAILVLADGRWYRVRALLPLTRFSRNARPGASSVPGGPEATRYLVPATLGVILVAALVYIAAESFGASDGRLHVYFLDVGQGDAIFVVTPDGRQALIDGGPDFGGATLALSEHLPPWDRSLDLVAATHLDADHSRGLLQVLEEYKIGAVIAGVTDEDSALYPQWRKAVAEGSHQLTQVSAGQSLTLDDDVILEVLHPPPVLLRGPAWDSNNNSLVLRLSYGNISFLLTGDIKSEAESYLARTAPALETDVLKAAHHGSNSSTTRRFLNRAQPSWAVISAGQDNQYGHPHPDVLQRLEESVGQGNIFSTANRGTIHFSTDGQRLWVETER